jgi:hypothetical protein
MRRPAVLIGLCLALAACGILPEIPDFRVPRRATPAAAPPMAATPLPPVEPLAPGAPGAVGAGAAEAACTAAGRERGFEVQGVIGSTDVIGADGRALSRDVMLRVIRSGQQVDLRCNYVYADGIARLMVL